MQSGSTKKKRTSILLLGRGQLVLHGRPNKWQNAAHPEIPTEYSMAKKKSKAARKSAKKSKNPASTKKAKAKVKKQTKAKKKTTAQGVKKTEAKSSKKTRTTPAKKLKAGTKVKVAKKRQTKPAKRATRKTSAKRSSRKAPSGEERHEAINRLAYQKWEEAGRPVTDGREFWLAAEQELLDVTNNDTES